MGHATNRVERVKFNEGELGSRTDFNNAQRAAEKYVLDAVLGPLFALATSGGDARSVVLGDSFLVAGTGGLGIQVAPGLAYQTDAPSGDPADPYRGIWKRVRMADAVDLSHDAGGAADRIDLVCARGNVLETDEVSTSYMDGAGNISSVPLKKRVVGIADVQIVKGTEGAGAAPAVPSGWFALADVPVAAGALAVGTLVDRRVQAVFEVPPGGLRFGGSSGSGTLKPKADGTGLYFSSSLPVFFDEVIAAVLRATTKIVLRTNVAGSKPRVLFDAIANGTKAGLFVHAFDDAEDEATETPAVGNRLFGVERDAAGTGTNAYLAGPGGTLAALAAGESVDFFFGGATDWLFRVTNEGAAGSVAKFLVSGTEAERISFLPDGRIRLARAGGPLAPTLSVRRRLPILGGHAYDSADGSSRAADLTYLTGGLVIASGGGGDTIYKIDVPESFDADGVALALHSVEVVGLAVAVTGGGEAILRKTTDLEGTPAESDAAAAAETWGPGDHVEKTIVATHTPSGDDGLFLEIKVPNAASSFKLYRATAIYKAHRLPA